VRARHHRLDVRGERGIFQVAMAVDQHG
jgi:hypothetical protein